MGATPSSKRPGSPLPLSSQQWKELREQSIRSAVRWGGSHQPEDDVQEALLRTFEAEARGTRVQDYQTYVASAGIKVARSVQRRLRVAAKHTPLLSEAPGLWHADAPPTPEAHYCRSVSALQAIAQEIWSSLEACRFQEQLFGYLFSNIVINDCLPWLWIDSNKNTNSSMENYLSCNSSSVSLQALKSSVKGLLKGLHRRDISAQDLYLVLRTPEAVLSSRGLTLAIAGAAACIIKRLQVATKKCRLDILYRSGLSRQDLYISKLPLYTMNLNNTCITARMPRMYTLLGMVFYLEEILNIEHEYQNIIDPNYVECLILKIIHDRPYISPIDRWLAIVTLGVFYQQESVELDYIEKKLSPVEDIARRHPVQRNGMAFTWLNAAKSDHRELLIREKVYPLLDPERSFSGLSQLPITIIGSYMGASPEVLSTALDLAENWHPILFGLQSKSYLANLGALSQLSHMPYHQPPSSIQGDLKATLHRLISSPIPFIGQQAKLLPRQYWD